MLGFFRRNLNFNLLALVIFTILLHVYYFIDYRGSEITWPLELFEGWFGVLDSKFPRILFAIFLIAIQGILVNRIVVKHKLSRALSTIPGAIFILYSVFILESEVFHPAMLGHFFVILSMSSLFNIYKRHLPVTTIFNSGLFLAIAALIYPAYITYAIVLFLGLFSLRNLELREMLQMTSGLLAPFFLIGVYFFYKGQLSMLSGLFLENMSLPWSNLSGGLEVWIKTIIVSVIIVLLIIFNSNNKKKKKYDAIKKVELCYWLLFLALISLFFAGDITGNHLILIAAPLAILSGLHMESNENKMSKEFLFLVMLAGVIAFQLQLL